MGDASEVIRSTVMDITTDEGDLTHGGLLGEDYEGKAYFAISPEPFVWRQSKPARIQKSKGRTQLPEEWDTMCSNGDDLRALKRIFQKEYDDEELTDALDEIVNIVEEKEENAKLQT